MRTLTSVVIALLRSSVVISKVVDFFTLGIRPAFLPAKQSGVVHGKIVLLSLDSLNMTACVKRCHFAFMLG